jgi:hypothetical protein
MIKTTRAQDISLSISPPIFELMIQPGKEYSFVYTLSNNGMETPLKIKIVPFSPDDEYGNIKFENISIYSDIDLESWFKIGGTPLDENQKLFLPRGASQQVVLTISPPAYAPEGDYYLTILFETDSSAFIGGQGALSNAQIGSNILLTVSKDGNPKKNAEVVVFSAPKIIDSLAQLSYIVKVKNTGSAFFKPIGKINISSLFGNDDSLTLAPQNILSSSTREIPCTKDEQLIRCTLSKRILFGIYNAKLNFTLDESDQIYNAQAITIAFPFSITAAFIIIFIIFKLILTKLKK